MKKPIINNELLGILYMILCQFSFATNDAMVKFIYQNFDEIYVLNQVIFVLEEYLHYSLLEYFYILKTY
jgi:hypothetical protein